MAEYCHNIFRLNMLVLGLQIDMFRRCNNVSACITRVVLELVDSLTFSRLGTSLCSSVDNSPGFDSSCEGSQDFMEDIRSIGSTLWSGLSLKQSLLQEVLVQASTGQALELSHGFRVVKTDFSGRQKI